ncbi:MAG: tetratricopeptide repeat protein [Parvibaculaceae bacterium]|nr:tetratricopeptide repeat protein [Parvibaculaceae bacterium]
MRKLHSLSMLMPLFFCFSLMFVLPASASTAVDAVASQEQGYGRIIFKWPAVATEELLENPDIQELPDYDAVVAANVLVLTFEKPFDVDMKGLLRQMPSYLALVRRDLDGKTLRLAMKSNYQINTQKAGSDLYLDLLPADWKGPLPGLPEKVVTALAERAEALKLAVEEKVQTLEIAEPSQRLDMRVGEHENFTRLVFDWGQPVLYTMVQRGNRATVTFDRSAVLSLARLRVDPPKFISSAISFEKDGRLTVSVDVPTGVVVSDFREDLSVVMDFSNADDAAASRQETKAYKPSGETIVKPDIGDDAHASVPAEKTSHQEAVKPHEPAAPADHGRPKDIKSAEAKVIEPSHVEDLIPDGGEVVSEGPVKVQVDVLGSSVRLTFPWAERVGAAVFQRAGKVWMVFDTTDEVDLSGIGQAARLLIGDPEIVPVDDATIVQFSPKERVLLTASEKGRSWIVTLGDVIVEPTRAITLNRGWAENGEAKVSLDLRGRGRVHWVRDPEVRDVLAIVTANGPGQGLVAPRNFVEFSAMATTQGLVFVQLADDLYVRALENEVIVSRGSGLTLSAANAAEYGKQGQRDFNTGDPGKMDFARWREVPGDDFFAQRQYYQKKLVDRDGDPIETTIRYAQFLMSYGLANETLALLRNLSRKHPDVLIEPAFKALRGVANFQRGLYEEALTDLSEHALLRDPHAALWRGALHAELGHWREARADFARAKNSFEEYEPDFQALFRVRAAEAELSAGDLPSVAYNLNQIPDGVENIRYQLETEMVRGRMFEAANRTDEALEKFERVIQAHYRPVSTKARFAKATLQHRSGLIDDQGLEEELERLKFAWRGDDLELAILERLAEMKLARGKVKMALSMMRGAVSHYPNTDRGRRMASRMTEIFTDLFLSGGADQMDSVEALALYYDFRELTPIGRRGDAMIRRLADRLVDVDLLGQAAELLQHQVDHRLRGIARAQVATKLALIRLMDRQPEQALAAIRSSRQALLPSDLASQRRLMEARALAELGLEDHALELLEEQDGEEAQLLRADVLWSSQQWEKSGEQVETMLGRTWASDEPLIDTERALVMRAAIAYSLADNPVALERLRKKYGEKMRASEDGNNFATVTEPIERQGVEFRALAREIAGVDTLDRFISSFRKRYDLTEGATAIN